jgi:hypothetical protein
MPERMSSLEFFLAHASDLQREHDLALQDHESVANSPRGSSEGGNHRSRALNGG